MVFPLIRRLFKILAFLWLTPFLLVLLYSFVPPISMPVIAETLAFEKVHWRWRSYDKISPNLPRLIIAAEDSRFCQHHGVDWQAVKKVMHAARKSGKVSRGASTISMQVVKNLFLWYLPGFVRKPLEVPMAMWADYIWSKKRMMEIYMNIAQFGDGIYGAEAASRAYFNKSAASLSVIESATLAAVLPNPVTRNAGKPSNYIKSFAGKIRARSSANLTNCLK